MPEKSRDIKKLTNKIHESMSKYYKRAHFTKKNSVAIVAKNAETQIRQARIGGTSKDNVDKYKDNLKADQKHLLQSRVPFGMNPKNDESFLTLQQNGLPRNPEGNSIEERGKYVSNLSTDVQVAFLKGQIGSECTYAGDGSRLKASMAKFNMTAQILLDKFETFYAISKDDFDPAKDPENQLYTKLTKQIEYYGGLSAIRGMVKASTPLTIGDRIFIRKAYDINQLGHRKFGTTDSEVREALEKFKFKIVVNTKVGQEIIESFVKNNFYGFNPNNFLFMKQHDYPTLIPNEDGTFTVDNDFKSKGNHGLIPFQSVMDNQWFRVLKSGSGNGKFIEESALPYTDYADYMRNLLIEKIESIEDVSQLTSSVDWAYLGLAKHHGEQNGVQFFMQMVANKKDNPQKGGSLVVNKETGKNMVIESDKMPYIPNNQIVILNRNANLIFKPLDFAQHIMESKMINDLHPTLSLFWKDENKTEPAVRVEPAIPQGDRNLYAKSEYIQFLPVSPIQNLKDVMDILPTLAQISYFDSNRALLEFAKNFIHVQF